EKGWTKIGEKTVNTSKGHEEITVPGSEKFSSIRIKVPEDAMVDLKDVQVEYEGGTKQKVDMTKTTTSSVGEGKVIELNSSDKNVKSISFAYEAKESTGSTSTGTMSGTKGTSSSTKGTTSKGTVSSSTSKESTGTSQSSKGTMGTQNSKAKIEIWGLKSETALK
ncbi:MAG TPA: hypothetical protein DCL77_10550, partial [Prolixibacteraceae bacterium]|nr:hypothetical protein [Prolixibacteraceae bacterium]